MGNTNSNKIPDVNFPDKEWGYLALEPTCVQFIGPDREPIDMSNKSQYLRAAEVIRESGLDNNRWPVSRLNQASRSQLGRDTSRIILINDSSNILGLASLSP